MEKELIFWAIAYQHQEEFFYNFEAKDDTDELTASCFLPTKELAEQYIEDELSIHYVPVKIYIEKFTGKEMVYSRGKVERWDD